MDIIYQGQRPLAEVQETHKDENGDHDNEQVEEEGINSMKSEIISNTEDQESYKREFFAMLEDVIELSSDFPSVLLDPEFSLVH